MFSVPAPPLIAGVVENSFGARIFEDCVALTDFTELLDDGFSRRTAARAEVPLKIADPKHQLGNLQSPRVQLDTGKLVRPDGMTFKPRQRLLYPSAAIASRTSPSRRFISSSEMYKKFPVPHAGSRIAISQRLSWKRRSTAIAPVRSFAERRSSAAASACRQSSRSGSMIVAVTSRST